MDNQQPLIELENITFAYENGGPDIINALNFTFYEKERVGLLAPNGSGKTTFFHIIMGLLKPRQGTIRIFGKKVQKEKDFVLVRRQIGLLFQDSDDQLFCPTVLEDVAFGPLNMGFSKSEARQKAEGTLAFLGLKDCADQITFKLSGGKKRLVALAAVLAMEPSVLLLDEPLTGLDLRTQQTLRDVLQDLSLSYIVISHDLDFLGATTDNIYTLENGTIRLDTDIHYHQHEHAHLFGNRPHRHHRHK